MSDKKILRPSQGGNYKAKLVSASLCLLMLIVAIISLFGAFVKSGDSKLSCFDFLATWNFTQVAEKLGAIPALAFSYYVTLGFYYLFILALVIMTISTVMAFLVGGEKVEKKLSRTITVLLVFLFLQMLFALNYTNVALYRRPELAIQTGTIVFFFIGVAVFIAKNICDITVGKSLHIEEIKESDSEIYNSFMQAVLALLGIICPIYVLPGITRVFGFDVMFGTNAHFMSYLPMSKQISIMLLVFMILTTALFVVNILVYKFHRKSFSFFNRLCGLVSKLSIYTYAFLGFNYILNYLEADGFSKMLTIALGTYAYIPLILLIMYRAGGFLAKLGANKVVIQYKVGGTADDSLEEAGSKSKNQKQEEKIEPAKIGGLGDPIPAFSELDMKAGTFEADYAKRMENKFENITLPALVDHIIEYAKYSREQLSYGPVEVKTFIAGLAASRLSILQGMSGTGKTSLPKIFMEAIDGYCEIVAIESSWRDKNELLGYYNEFNKKYTPKTFTQYLYKASLNKEIPTFIVLDEMNLSRIEYYFSDFLSLMEARENARFIKLYDVQLFPSIDDRTNYLALRDGHTIDIPTNVWFIGTANRDESTFEISDKVYDRAQTMNFDKRAPKVSISEEKTIPKKYVPYSVLRRLFDATKAVAFDAERYEPIKKVEKLLLPYKISFGNRVLKQIETFVNAYVACSDIQSQNDRARFTHEAVDCILFSKVVRKLELKQITDIDEMIEAFRELKFTKSVEFLTTLKDSV